ncbi:MAG: ABC transporter substrate-binding protein [Clostridiales bacterium]|nr:ABC transporter substrate-binding protein [Clostridiales bacterium]MCI1961306.1 ABC transporter substrate-binding protein [Clostridiales bacterium]MCI2021747.1 ABC transporter substrate-binding protein [Clostridiales bacterium]MCI2026534.1 ABC transporter substrate-binding protein [Clostridiales bacterium]
MKKKLIRGTAVLMVGALMASVFSGCGTSTSSSTNPSQAGEKKYKIGIIQPMDHPSLDQIRETIISELSALGMDDKIEIDYENAQGDTAAVTTIINNMLSSNVDMLVPIATGPAQACAKATKDVPIIFSAVSNPIEAKLVDSFDKTDGNITGVSNSIAVEDIFKLAQELTPNVKTYGFVYNPGEVNSVTGINRAKTYCDANGITYKEATVTNSNDVQQAVQSLVGKVDAFFTPNDNTVASAMPLYEKIAEGAKIPVYVGADSMVKDGGLATVGIDYTVLGKQTAQMIKRVIDGQTIAQTPVESIQEYAKMINTDTAKKLGITIPQSLQGDFQQITTTTVNSQG